MLGGCSSAASGLTGACRGSARLHCDHPPSTSMRSPPASLTITAPAAMSQQWIPISKKASTAPVATRHMLVAAVPDPRSLSGHINHTWVQKKEERPMSRAAATALQSVSSLFLSISMHCLPVHWDAKDLLLGGEDLGHHTFIPVGSVLGDDDGLVDVCEGKTQRQSRKERKKHQPLRALDLSCVP